MKKSLFFLVIIPLLFGVALPVAEAKTCKAKLMTTSGKLNKKLTELKKTNEMYNYSIYYSPKWKFDELEEGWYQFVSPYKKSHKDGSIIESSLVVNPFTPKNLWQVSKGPSLKTKTVKIDGKDAVWKQWWNDKYCFEQGEIQFIGDTQPAEGWKADNFISYSLMKTTEASIIKSMIYSIKFN
ncbi:hypothetical protein HZC21_04485 [Candidatus Peregrinibacteria bacterium]|nr:hypothetical protein [Candidatus Peregrinibacteria bacterium]